MTCKECNEAEIIKVYKPDKVVFKCKKGHTWFEDYIENGGPHNRPSSYETKLDDILFPSEKKLYDKILKEIEKNQEFYTSSNAEKITSHLIDNCKFDKDDTYKLFKKITKFNNNSQ